MLMPTTPEHNDPAVSIKQLVYLQYLMQPQTITARQKFVGFRQENAVVPAKELLQMNII